jgi:branched-chain amino acid transport system substrate-binding protein
MRILINFTFFASLAVVLLGGATGKAGEIVIGYSGPLSGPAAEYGQDLLNGVDMAIKELNSGAGIMVNGQQYSFRLERRDDRADPTQAINNARSFRSNGAIAVFNGVFTTIAPMMKINQEKGNEFIVVAYSSTPMLTKMGNKLMVSPNTPFTVNVGIYVDWAKSKGWKKCAMVITLGAYGDEWRHTFKAAWEKKGGTITADYPANYYMETDFAAPLTAALATKPDCLLIGGPSAATALVIEQSRALGYKGGFIMIDQAKQDHVAAILKGTKLMGTLIALAKPEDLPVSPGNTFKQRYRAVFKRPGTWESAITFTSMHALAKAVVSSQSVSDVYKIRAAMPKVFPLFSDTYPMEYLGMSAAGRFYLMTSIQSMTDGKSDAAVQYAWWPKTRKEFEEVKKLSTIRGTTKKWWRVDDN